MHESTVRGVPRPAEADEFGGRWRLLPLSGVAQGQAAVDGQVVQPLIAADGVNQVVIVAGADRVHSPLERMRTAPRAAQPVDSRAAGAAAMVDVAAL